MILPVRLCEKLFKTKYARKIHYTLEKPNSDRIEVLR